MEIRVVRMKLFIKELRFIFKRDYELLDRGFVLDKVLGCFIEVIIFVDG